MASRDSGGQRRLRASARRREIINEALPLFAENGYANTALREIAEAVGITKATLYYHFATKEDLLAAIHGEVLDVLLDKARARIQRGGTSRELVCGYILDGMEMLQDYRLHMEIMIRERFDFEGPLWRVAAARRREYSDFLRDAIAVGVRSGEFRPDIDPAIAALGIVGMTNFAHQWFEADGRMGAPEIAAELAELVLLGMVAHPGRDPGAAPSQDVRLG